VTSHVSAESFLNQILAQQYELFILERFKDKSRRPQTKEQILEAHARSGLTHLDLVATPL
jgi:hypothetical protein